MRAVILALLFTSALAPQTVMRVQRRAVAGGLTQVVTGQSLGTLRNDYGPNYVGFRFTVGGSNITVSELCRWVVSGNTASHDVSLFNGTADPANIIGTVTITTSGAPVGFKCVALGTPVVLTASAVYYLTTNEVLGGDQWYDSDTTLTTTGAITISSAAYEAAGSLNTTGTANHSMGPVGFKY